ncbi:hypothetical protein BC827DRAFT_1268705 [Russula dissimulans]|nr:hypothetical protein BC827DRAFT_1268705 [Russula dissimulans]
MNFASTSSGLQVTMEVENIIIKRRRKRFLPPEPCLDQPCARAPINTSLPDNGRLLDSVPDSDGTRENYPLPEHSSTLGDHLPVDESSPVLSPDCSHSDQMIHNRELQSVTIHEFLQHAVSKAGRNYGRKNRLATTKLDVHYRSKDCSSSPIVRQDDETQNDQRVAAHPRIQTTKHLSREVRRLRRKKRFAKPLAQRLFEADVFSSGTSSRPTSARLEDPAHTSSCRPLPFITSLNLTPSLESRIYGTQKQKGGCQGEATEEDSISAAESEMLAVSEFSSSDHASPTRNHRPFAAASLAPSNKYSNHCQTAAVQRARTGRSAGVLAPGKKAPHVRGGKRGRAQVPRSPFEYAPLPLSRVRTHRKAVPTPSQYGVHCSLALIKGGIEP